MSFMRHYSNFAHPKAWLKFGENVYAPAFAMFPLAPDYDDASCIGSDLSVDSDWDLDENPTFEEWYDTYRGGKPNMVIVMISPGRLGSPILEVIQSVRDYWMQLPSLKLLIVMFHGRSEAHLTLQCALFNRFATDVSEATFLSYPFQNHPLSSALFIEGLTYETLLHDDCNPWNFDLAELQNLIIEAYNKHGTRGDFPINEVVTL